MTYEVLADDGRGMDAHVEVDPTGITFHSRGGSSAKGTVKNADYGPALRLLLRRITSAHLSFDRAWVDSSEVQGIPVEDRTILRREELDPDASSAFTLMSNRMKAVGQANDKKGGNSTKRVRIQFATEIDVPELEQALRVSWIDKDLRSAERLPTQVLRQVTAEHVWNAIERLRDPTFKHAFGPSTDFDLVTETGERFPPKAVFGVAASEALGFKVLPKHFSGGEGTICFKVLDEAGYDIVPKNQTVQVIDIPVSTEDRLWTEGKPRLIAHLRRERASGLAQAKKELFLRTHGHLTCEHCGIDPVQVYGGLHGAACIEVHHQAVQVENMAEAHQTKLEDLQCLCANCHRVEHRLLKQRSDEILSSSDFVNKAILERIANSLAHGLSYRLHCATPAVQGGRPPTGPLWVHEIKYDGYRLMARRDGSRSAATPAMVTIGPTASRPRMSPAAARRYHRAFFQAKGKSANAGRSGLHGCQRVFRGIAGLARATQRPSCFWP